MEDMNIKIQNLKGKSKLKFHQILIINITK